MACIPADGQTGPLPYARGQAGAGLAHRSGYQVDRAYTERAVLLACEAVERAVADLEGSERVCRDAEPSNP